jgi:4-amino-4-deoxy-L-arabinose transferase-like glycosyltransferase
MGKNLARACQWFLLRPLAYQVLIVLLAWTYLCLLHWNNDGLWFQGDAPRHAANGLFWKDYLQSFSLDPKGYALSYYARYPSISLTTYPPAFHLLEAGAFGFFGPSPYVAKGLVLCFALLAGLYTTAWLRRWVAPEAGWAGALVLLLPGVIAYAHAVLPNVAAFALSVGALYHVHRWLDSPGSRHIYWAAALSVLAVGTYFPAGAIAFIGLAWLMALRRWEALRRPQTFVVAALCVLLVLPSLWIVFRWTPGYMSANLSADPWELSKWLYYLRNLDQLFNPYLLALAGLGAVTGLWDPRWRRETGLLLLWAGISYLLFSLLRAQHSRYLLPLSTVLVCLCAMALLTLARWLAQLAHGRQGAIQAAATASISAVLVIQLWLAPRVHVPSLHGFQEVTAFLAEKAPDEPVLYDGFYNNVFTFYLQAGDPDYRRRVVRGDKLLYASALFQTVNVREFVSSPAEVVEVLRTRGGCRWLAIEGGDFPVWVPAAQWLRKVVTGPDFELVRSFPITGAGVNRVDLYRFLVPIQQSAEVDLPFPIMGSDAHQRVKPISRRHAISDAGP